MDPVEQFQGAELFSFKSFVLLVDDDSHEHLDHNFINFFADLIDVPILIGFDVVDPQYLISLLFLLLEFLNFEGLQFGNKFLCVLLLEGHSDLHLPSGYFVPFLEQFDAI